MNTSTPSSLKATASGRLAQSEDEDVSLHRGKPPPELAARFDRLYRHIYSSSAFFETFECFDDETHLYLARREGRDVAALAFRIDGRVLRVINEQITINAGELERFAAYAFATFKTVSCIVFRAIHAHADFMRFPFQSFKCTEDIVLKLPATTDAYLDGLGKATRSYIKRYQRKLERDFPAHAFQFSMGAEVSEQDVAEIIAFNKARMTHKRKSFDIGDVEVGRIVRLARLSGVVGVLRIDGRICAGTVNFRCGDNYFLRVIAHDSRYNDYRLGILCCYLTICRCIEQGGNEYHFMWGRYDYKFRLSGVLRHLHQIAIYPSRRHAVLNAGTALKIAREGYGIAARRWLLDRAEQKGEWVGSRMLFHGLNWVRELRR